MNDAVRVRFAPSNTGHLHIGGARTALFNWFFARHTGGTAILRIEDTDQERSTEAYYDAIIEAFEWLGLDWDEGPYRQTERMALYTEAAKKMLDAGTAYRCTCTPDEVDEMRKKARAEGRTPKYDGTCRGRYDTDPDLPFCLRLKVPDEGETVVDDLLAGPVTFQNDQLDDMVIARTDGTPTYNFCVAVDDIDMRITHVIRGNDHLSNTPKQILVYQALGESPPRFVHISMILGSDKKRLSKRHGATSVLEFREQGYLPEAFINYLVRLGWSLGDQEIFSCDEIIKNFSIENLNLSSAVLNPEKMLWTNQEYIMKGDAGRLLELLEERLRARGLAPELLSPEARLGVVEELRTRAKTLEELADGAAFFFSPGVTLDEKAAAKFLISDIAAPLGRVREAIAGVEPFAPEGIKEVFEGVLEAEDMKLGKLAQPVRFAITGGTKSPGIFETLALLGKERSLERLDAALARIENP
ncbi:MAG: glutamate--tRNA ligase [Nitrospinaceae bacterium]|nr:glutamate--tRNA ligase [Nitrospinaceae bacterium]